MNQMLTLLRRELIEHQAGWRVAAVLGGLFLLATLLGIFGVARIGGEDFRGAVAMMADAPDPAAVHALLMVMFMPIAMLFVLLISIVVLFYLLDSLYAERKDRSILFWKSLPVSDLKVVGSKYLTAVAGMPAQALAVFVATVMLIWLLASTSMLIGGTAQFVLRGPLALLQVTIVMIYTLVALALWLAPVHGWLLLVSAFARRAVLGWALLPPLLLVVAERILFGTRYFAGLLGQRLTGGLELAFSGRFEAMIEPTGNGVVAMFPALSEFLSPGRFLGSPALWAGLVVGALFLAGAVWLRRWRDES